MSASIILVGLTGSVKMKLMATSASVIQAFLDKTVNLALLVQLKIFIIKLLMTNVTISKTNYHMNNINNSARLYFLEMVDFSSQKI